MYPPKQRDIPWKKLSVRQSRIQSWHCAYPFQYRFAPEVTQPEDLHLKLKQHSVLAVVEFKGGTSNVYYELGTWDNDDFVKILYNYPTWYQFHLYILRDGNYIDVHRVFTRAFLAYQS